MPLPDFLIISTAKAGTTSLYRYLAQHPQIYMSPIKEPNFFALEGQEVDFCGPGDEMYIKQFSVTDCGGYEGLFEGSVAKLQSVRSRRSISTVGRRLTASAAMRRRRS